MFRIVICDDEDTLIGELQGKLQQYAAETGREFCFFIYHDGSELLQEYRPEYDLIFMDIKMEKLNGLKTAEEIRKMDSSVGLIFLTSLKQYVWKGYEYRAVNYLLKPVKSIGRKNRRTGSKTSPYAGRPQNFVQLPPEHGYAADNGFIRNHHCEQAGTLSCYGGYRQRNFL